MTGNRYLAVARLATHPAFRSSAAALVCPLCGGTYARVTDYDRDFLGHQPDAELGWWFLPGRRYEREAARRGWPVFDEALANWPDTERAAGRCRRSGSGRRRRADRPP